MHIFIQVATLDNKLTNTDSITFFKITYIFEPTTKKKEEDLSSIGCSIRVDDEC